MVLSYDTTRTQNCAIPYRAINPKDLMSIATTSVTLGHKVGKSYVAVVSPAPLPFQTVKYYCLVAEIVRCQFKEKDNKHNPMNVN